jgi:hypothetical protein
MPLARLFPLIISALAINFAITQSAASQIHDFSDRRPVEGSFQRLVPMQTVVIPAGELFHYSNQLGFGPLIQFQRNSLMVMCNVFRASSGGGRARTTLRVEYWGPHLSSFFPPPLGDDYHRCSVRLFGMVLQNGWELVSLSNIEDSDCPTNSNSFYSLTRRGDHLVDSTYDLELSALSNGENVGSYCLIIIQEAVLRGPIGSTYNGAFNY